MKFSNLISFAALGYSIYASKEQTASINNIKGSFKDYQAVINDAVNQTQENLEQYTKGGTVGQIFSASYRVELAGIRDTLWNGAFWITLENLTDSPKHIVGIRLQFAIDGVTSVFWPMIYIDKTIPAKSKVEIRLSGGNDIKMWKDKSIKNMVRDALLATCPATANKKTIVAKLIAAEKYNWKNISKSDVDIVLWGGGVQNDVTKTLRNVPGVITYMGPAYLFSKWFNCWNGYGSDKWHSESEI